MSGHGNSEEYRSWTEVIFDGDNLICPEESDNYRPSCKQAGNIIYERCIENGKRENECRQDASQAEIKAAYLKLSKVISNQLSRSRSMSCAVVSNQVFSVDHCLWFWFHVLLELLWYVQRMRNKAGANEQTLKNAHAQKGILVFNWLIASLLFYIIQLNKWICRFLKSFYLVSIGFLICSSVSWSALNEEIH